MKSRRAKMGERAGEPAVVRPRASRVRVGTSGFAYREWKGSFYPDDLPDAEMLRHYATQFDTVEINNTFYRMPTVRGLSAWADQTPEDFSFVLKASRRITHDLRLREADEPLGYLVRTASELGPRLGPILFQLPPNMKKDVGRLRHFLGLLPDGFRAAFEFRNRSWFDDETYGALSERGVALVAADSGNPKLPAELVRTAPYGYARFRLGEFGPGELEGWAERLSEPGWEQLHVFFKHEEAGTGPELARRFRGLMASRRDEGRRATGSPGHSAGPESPEEAPVSRGHGRRDRE